MRKEILTTMRCDNASYEYSIREGIEFSDACMNLIVWFVLRTISCAAGWFSLDCQKLFTFSLFCFFFISAPNDWRKNPIRSKTNTYGDSLERVFSRFASAT